MIAFPNAKINIGLNITGKREDGYHDIKTIFYPIGIRDALEVIEDPGKKPGMIFTHSGDTFIEDSDNLCIKAYNLLCVKYPLPAVKAHLHKAIPMGAGLGGGSSDASSMLLLLNKKFELGIPHDELSMYALQLGSDCPFFMLNKPCLATGRGEILKEISLDLSPYQILLVNPGIHISTSWAFQQLHGTSNKDLEILIKELPGHWSDITNDFEGPVFEKYPEIANIKNQLYARGAIYASMSGSGSSVYGIFQKDELVKIEFPTGYYVQEL